MLKFTEYSSDNDWKNGECKVTETLKDVHVSRSKIVLVKSTQVYRGKDHDKPDMSEYVEKTLIVFDGNENYITVNETVPKVLEIIMLGNN